MSDGITAISSIDAPNGSSTSEPLTESTSRIATAA